jgi:predicted RNA-binding Zn-ribbon protein involved in translation (DUF1610 family)
MARLRCPRCGAEMNRHAEKLVHPESAEEAASMDAALGGVLMEAHACPACGNVEGRRVRLAGSA